MNWITDTKPPERGYYIAAWRDEGHWRVSELWYNPQSTGSGWWPTRGYMARFVGDVASTAPVRSLTVAAWMPIAAFPGPGRIIAYKARTVVCPSCDQPWKDQVFVPSEISIVREPASEPGDTSDKVL